MCSDRQGSRGMDQLMEGWKDRQRMDKQTDKCMYRQADGRRASTQKSEVMNSYCFLPICIFQPIAIYPVAGQDINIVSVKDG